MIFVRSGLLASVTAEESRARTCATTAHAPIEAVEDDDQASHVRAGAELERFVGGRPVPLVQVLRIPVIIEHFVTTAHLSLRLIPEQCAIDLPNQGRNIPEDQEAVRNLRMLNILGTLEDKAKDSVDDHQRAKRHSAQEP